MSSNLVLRFRMRRCCFCTSKRCFDAARIATPFSWALIFSDSRFSAFMNNICLCSSPRLDTVCYFVDWLLYICLLYCMRRKSSSRRLIRREASISCSSDAKIRLFDCFSLCDVAREASCISREN